MFFYRIEKDKNQIMVEIADVRAATDEVCRSKVSSYSQIMKIQIFVSET